jgi:hypothetical protein
VSPAVALTSKIPSPCIGDGMVLAGAEGRRLLEGYSKVRQVGGPVGRRSHLGAFEYSIMISRG